MTGLGLGVGAVVAEGIGDAKAADAIVDAEDADGAVTAEGAGDAELPQPTRHIPKRPASNRELRRMLVTTTTVLSPAGVIRRRHIADPIQTPSC